MPLASDSTAPTGDDSARVNVSSASPAASVVVLTLTVLVATPAANVTGGGASAV